MIFIDRSKEAIPKILVASNAKGVKETAKAILHYSGLGKSKPFNFTVYRNPQVKDALIRLFKGKCAYCESKFLHVYSGDVEHFRPKGEVTGANPTKPGYYWLAADWNNLLLSCRNCNQKLTHQIHGATVKKTMGKMNQFPLVAGAVRVRRHDAINGIANEEPNRLLINPCIDDPEIHFEYDEIHAVIRPKKIGGASSEKAISSIDVYVLQRVPLVLAREKILIDILAQIQRVKEAVKNVNANLARDVNLQFYFDKILKRELQRLKAFMEPTAEYSAMAKQIINKFLNLNFGIIP